MFSRVRRVLVTVLVSAVAVTGLGGWAVGERQVPVTGPVPGAAAWRADRVLGRPLPDPATASPRDVAAFFARLSPAERQLLVTRHPLVVGNLDGVPPALRYRANALAYREHTGRALPPGRRLVAFDPRGRGQFAEVWGDLAHARHVAVLVPGTDVDVRRHDTAVAMARNLYRRMAQDARRDAERGVGRRAAPASVAVVLWVGYTTPSGVSLDAATPRLAAAGAPRLHRFLAGLDAVGVPAPAVFCHSYGSVVCGLAASRLARAEAADLVLFASPGTGAATVADLDTDARVWAAKASSDWIRVVPHVRLLGLGHGTDPTAPGFGARVVSADRVDGHAGYLAPGSDALANFSAIARGDLGAVRCAGADPRACTRDLR